MPAPTALVPGTQTPDLSLKLTDGSNWSANTSSGENFSLLVFYRGYHCPKCREQLLEIQSHLPALSEKGVNVTAISMDPQDRAEKTPSEWEISELDIAYGLSETEARAWGLHMSASRGKTSIGVEELKIFNEPGMFLIRNDGSLFASWVQTVPAGRPNIEELIGFINFVLTKDYPPRGTLA